MRQFLFSFLLVGIGGFIACTSKPDYNTQIKGMEARLTAEFTPERSDSLVNLYREAVKSDPNNHATNLHYLTRAADIQFNQRNDAPSAARWIADALSHHASGQNLTETIGLLTRIWNAYQYKTAAAVRLTPDDIDAMSATLKNNMPWIDSSLVALDKKMATNGLVTDKAAVGRFIETAEGYATVAYTSSPDKSAELLLLAAGAAKTVESYGKAVQLYYKISEKMPEHPKAPTALFMQGFVYENDLKDLDKAKAIYESFLKRFPNDADYADDAQMALKNLGKSPEEMIREFEKKAGKK